MSWALSPGDSLTCWEVSDPTEKVFPGEARAMPDSVDHRFVNGWVATGDLPCREAWRRHAASRDVTLAQMPPTPRIHVDERNPLVDFSCFRFLPTVVARWARTVLHSSVAQGTRWRLTTCGGVRLWLDDAPVARFERYERNDPGRFEFELSLAAGGQTLALYLDDLHERDTRCYFRLELLAGEGLSVRLDDVDPARLAAARRALAELRPTRLFFDGGALTIHRDIAGKGDRANAPGAASPARGAALPLRVRIEDPTGRTIASATTAALAADGAALALAAIDALPAGCAVLSCSTDVGRARIGVRIAATVLPRPLVLDQPRLAARKRAALAVMRDADGALPSLALARLEGRARDDRAEALIGDALRRVEQRRDCADFDLLPLLWIREAHGARLPRALVDALDRTILGFRYWMDEPGNDVMWFWSENHALCFHAAQYLAGAALPEHRFGNGGALGARQRALGLARLERWFDAIEREGLVEWNSVAYYPIDLLALFALLRLAPDARIRERARRLCDEILAMTALHTLGGVAAGSQGRAYEKELFAGPATELGSVAAISFGGPWHAGHDRAAAPYALLDYEPPAALAHLAAPAPGKTVEARYTQGLDGAASLRLWKCDAVQLSSVVDHRSGRPGHQQHVVDAQLGAHPLARCWINHPGDLGVWGEARPSYWAGNGVLPRVAQRRNTAMLVFDLRARTTGIGFTHVFCPRDVLDELVVETCWLFLRAGSGYVAVFGSGPLEAVRHGLYSGSEWRLHADRSAWLLTVGSASLHGSFARFREECLRTDPLFEAPAMRLTARLADGLLSLAHDAPLTLDDREIDAGALAGTPRVSVDGAPYRPWRDVITEALARTGDGGEAEVGP